MIIADVVQGTPEWEQLRIGIPTASRFHELVTSKGVQSATRKKLLYTLAGERKAVRKEESFKSNEMARGNLLEDEARTLYELIKGVSVEQVGFCFLNERRMVGASPDGLVGADGGVEIKTAKLSIQVERLLAGTLPAGKMQQVQGCMYVTGRKWWDFVSYCAGLPPLIIRVARDEVFIAALDREIKLFCSELARIVEKIQ